jgi:O-antigen/teichoic acid export membrane protein
MTTLLAALLLALVAAFVITRRYAPPPTLTPTRALILLLMCNAVFLLSVGALQDPLMQREGWIGIVASLVMMAGLVVVIVDELRRQSVR